MRLRWTALMVLGVLTILTSSCSSSNGNTVAPGQPNPTPIITGLFPSSVTVGSQSFTMFIAGTGFIDGSTGTSTAFWNGSARSASVNINTGQMAITVLASDIATPGTSLITVSNPLPGGGISINAAPFTVYPTQTNSPLIASISPATASPNAPTFTLTVNGSNFVSGNANNPAIPLPQPPFSGSVVAFNGAPLNTAFVSPTQLTAQITNLQILTAGCNGVSVYTYTGGGNEIFSPAVSFLVSSTNQPALCSLLPSSVVAGATDFPVTVSGGSFSTNSTVRWNNSARTTTFVNANTLTAQIKAADVARPGVEPITVVNSGGGASPPLNFSILPTPPITPTISAITPDNANAGTGGFTLTVTGTNFLVGSVIDWNGAARATTFKSSTSLQAQILFTDILTPGTIEITVLNVSSNGASAFSNPFPFTINAAATAAVKFPQVVSVSIAGGPADGPSEAPAISSSGGRYVAFYSQAKNLIAPAVSGNIFVRDACMGTANCSPKTSAVDVAPDGSAPNGKAGRQVAISGDGRFVAFVSRATNLVPGNAGASLGYWELFVRDLCVGPNAPSGCTPHTESISLGSQGEAANGPITSPSLSADGRFIAFVSAATNLGGEKPASLPQAYVRDTCAGPTATKACVVRTIPVPVDDEDRIAGAQAGRPTISADGRYVALEMWTAKSAAQNSTSTSQIALADTCMGIEPPVTCEASAERISFAPDDSTLGGANISPSLSGDARFVVFESQPAASSTGNAAQLSRSYLRDTCLGDTAPDGCVPSTTLITNDSTTGSTTAAAKTLNFSPAISASGRYISFVSGAAAATVPAGQVATEGSLVVRDTCFGAVLPCTPHTYAVSAATAVFSATRAAIAVSSSNKSAPLVSDRYTSAPLSSDGRFAVFYAPDTIAAQPASGAGDVYLTVTPF